jgi:hypothetical protein
LAFDVDTGKPSRYTTDIKRNPPVFTLSCPSGGVTEVLGEICVSNYFGETLKLPVKARVAVGETVRLPLDLTKVKSNRVMGIWRARAVLAAGGAVFTNDTSFAYLPYNPVTPRLPRGRFRLGLQYHMGRFSDDFQPIALDALAAIGCKLVRVGGFHADACWPKDAEQPDFSRAEKMMEWLKRYGLSVNVFCWPNAKWMAEEKDQKRPYPAYIRSRPKKGLMGFYAEKLAARFGTDIDYVEPSNEPDFWGRDSMGIDDYIDYQREVYAGVKRGCKDIAVLSPGWALPDSSHPRVVHKGFQERFMVEAKDAYDIHAIHMHGMFPDYEKTMNERFFPARKKHAVAAPWYANETAMTCINGAEDAVAGTLWKKILWSRAHGSVDYIWYNLIATGSDPKDPEQGFGMLTRDLKPRATFAAFAALANLLRDLEFDCIIHEGNGRYLYRWKNVDSGEKNIVLVGWDEYAETPMSISVKSDAKAAIAVDLMGNRLDAQKKKDSHFFKIGQLPSALMLQGASFAETDRKDVERVSIPKKMSRIAKAKIKWRAPDFQLMAWWQVHEIYAANWETVERTWKGLEDLSSNVYVGSESGCLCVYFKVRDDVKASKDSVWVSVEPPDRSRKFEFRAYRQKDGKEVGPGRVDYELKIPLADIGFTEETLKNGFMFQVKVFDDDGLGEDIDFWMESRHCWVSIVFE